MCHFFKTCELQVRSIVFTHPKTILKKIKIIKTLMGWGDGGGGGGEGGGGMGYIVYI